MENEFEHFLGFQWDQGNIDKNLIKHKAENRRVEEHKRMQNERSTFDVGTSMFNVQSFRRLDFVIFCPSKP